MATDKTEEWMAKREHTNLKMTRKKMNENNNRLEAQGKGEGVETFPG